MPRKRLIEEIYTKHKPQIDTISALMVQMPKPQKWSTGYMAALGKVGESSLQNPKLRKVSRKRFVNFFPNLVAEKSDAVIHSKIGRIVICLGTR